MRLASKSREVAVRLILAAVLSCSMSACDGGGPPPAPILLLSLDTLRADHLSSYGYARATSPNLDAFARDSVRFANAHAQSSGTLPSHLSLLTSLNPPHFRITRNDGRNTGQGTTRLRIPDGVETLAEALREHGYETAAFTDGGATNARYGLDQGFDRYHMNAERGLASSIVELSTFLFDRSVRLAGIDPSDRPPLFLFVHTYDVHAPYDAPAPFDRRFSESTFGKFRASLNADQVLNAKAMRDATPDSALANELRGLYDNGIAWTDYSVAKLFAVLREHGLFDDALIAVVSDHGEEFLDHGGLNHGRVYEENLHVPLLIRQPKAHNAGRVVDEPVALIDVAPTLMELAGLPVAPGFTGASLVDLIESRDDEAKTRLIYFETPDRDDGSHGILEGHWKLIRDENTGALELFDLDADPLEQSNLADVATATSIRLSETLVRWVESMEARGRENGWFALPNLESPELSPEQRETLRALGYIGGKTSDGDRLESPLH